jgi:lipoate-protein ligase A
MHQNPHGSSHNGLDGDWALFQAVERGETHHVYRCWQTARPVVVAGRHRPLSDDVRLDACRADAVPIVRRPSGGGTVVLGDGCLNYAVACSFVSRPELIDVPASFATILRAIADALDVPGLSLCGGTDLALDGRKVSGNAQRRGRRALLHHGTLLFAFDPSLAARYLKEPARQPAYRAGRRHADFMTNIPMPAEQLQARLELGLRALDNALADAR